VYPSTKKRAKTAAGASWEGYIEWKQSLSLEVCSRTGAILSITWDRDDAGPRDPLSAGSAKRRKYAIQYLYDEVFGSPKEVEWAAPNFHQRLSLPRILMDMLDIPNSGKEATITAMQAMSEAHEAGGEYDPSRAIKAGRGAKVLIEDYTPQAGVVYRTMESGMSLGNAMVVLNQWRRAQKMTPPNISYGCLQRFVKQSPVMVLEKRETVKAGSADAGTVWAGARVGFASQVKRQLRKGARIAAGGVAYVPAEDGDDPVHAALEVPIFRGGRGLRGRAPPQDEARQGHQARVSDPQGRGGKRRAKGEGWRAPEEKPHDDDEVSQGGARPRPCGRGEGRGGSGRRRR
jgi:hypothetical protein